MRVAAGRDDIPCSAFVPAGDAPQLQAYLRWTESVAHPEVLQTPVAGGLLPARNVGSSRMALIAKTMEEIAVTARLRKSFQLYLVPLRAGDVHTCGLLAAFFDDHDEPLTIRTLLFDEELTREIFEVLLSDSFDMHFFDEHNRRLIGFRAENPDATRFRSFANTIRLVPGTLEIARQFHDDMTLWFGARSTADDNAAFRINLLETLLPDNLRQQSQTPGDFNERDIEMGLHRAFSGDQVYRNPVRANEGREFVDVLVATPQTVLLIQAKDSPITEATLSRTIHRKKATTAGHVKKAAAQLKGSINHLRSGSSIEIVTDGQRCDVSMSGREVFGLVIVKELFDLERSASSRLVLSVFEETDIPCLLLDYLEFQQLTFSDVPRRVSWVRSGKSSQQLASTVYSRAHALAWLRMGRRCIRHHILQPVTYEETSLRSSPVKRFCFPWFCDKTEVPFGIRKRRDNTHVRVRAHGSVAYWVNDEH